MIKSSQIRLLDLHTKNTVDALLHEGLTEEQIRAAQTEWEPIRKKAIEALYKQGVPMKDLPKHWGWDWTKKMRQLGDPLSGYYGIECGGKMQGLIMIEKEGHLAKLPVQKGKPLIYVKYIETAPWNVKLLDPKPRYGGVGSRLIRAAVELSISEDCKGRLGLHSLPGNKHGEPEWFYKDVCKMEPLEEERDGEGLLYFELTVENAEQFMRGGQS
ncbi:MAG: hypothetical protein OJF50_006613 [Nitrospira sp.]|nr:hypothetical protein [Nitrospira sp.]